ncbi:unnamed protein product [Candidula unifasciata]|uniref:Cyclin-dependent kinase 2-interacting protein n=1 Tax=Candidula unifasciata TaxID=100452 RepID=A0A8S3YPU0_9EUPU|nr:unnamed protein product [Candidula unifasciata]
MSSNSGVVAAGLLSPVSSPVPQAKQNSYANLTGDTRRAKDLAADFHDLMAKWTALNSQGAQIIAMIANIKIGQVFNMEEGNGQTGTITLPPELGPLCDCLSDIVEKMSKLEAKMHLKVKTATGLSSYQQQYKAHASSSILFSTMTLQDVAETLKTIHEDFEQELQFKREICRQVAHADSRDMMMFYSSSWMHQPYIRSVCCDLLEALLVETGHVR